jgi:hypothetical protein
LRGTAGEYCARSTCEAKLASARSDTRRTRIQMSTAITVKALMKRLEGGAKGGGVSRSVSSFPHAVGPHPRLFLSRSPTPFGHIHDSSPILFPRRSRTSQTRRSSLTRPFARIANVLSSTTHQNRIRILTCLPAVAVSPFLVWACQISPKDFGPSTGRRLPPDFIETPSLFQGAARRLRALGERESRTYTDANFSMES